MIVFQNISKKYGDRIVLDDINLEIEGGEFVSLIGPSGAGKTTLIQLLIGSEKPDFGNISVDDYNITSMDKDTLQFFRRNLGIVFQDLKLLPRKTVYENVAFVLEVCDAADEEIRQRVPEALELVGLLDHMNHFPDQLSGGEQQKACIARAIVHKPKLLIADEPTGNLDPESTREIIDILLKIHEQGTTILLASHDNEMVDSLRKRVLMIHRGRLVSDRKEGIYDLGLLREILGAEALTRSDGNGYSHKKMRLAENEGATTIEIHIDEEDDNL